MTNQWPGTLPLQMISVCSGPAIDRSMCKMLKYRQNDLNRERIFGVR